MKRERYTPLFEAKKDKEKKEDPKLAGQKRKAERESKEAESAKGDYEEEKGEAEIEQEKVDKIEKEQNPDEEIQKYTSIFNQIQKQNKPKKAPEKYMGKTGDEVFVSKVKSGKEGEVDYKLVNTKNKKMIDLSFKKAKEAKKYAVKGGMVLK